MAEFMKANNTELDEVFSSEELKGLETTEVEDTKTEAKPKEEVVASKKKKVEPEAEVEEKTEAVKAMAEPEVVAPSDYKEEEEDEGTLGAFMRKKDYEESEEYKQKKAAEAELEAKLQDSAELDSIMEMATLSGDSLNHLTLLDTSKMAKPAPAHFKNNRPTYQVTLNQSAYIAHMEGLKFPDVFNINSSIANDYETALKKYKTYYDKIAYTSIGISSFEEFSNMTSLFDVDTLAFGILNQTFPGKIKYDITCKNCGQVMSNTGISNDKLIVVKDDSIYEQVAAIINSVDSPEKADEVSLVNKVTRIQLKDSKTILDIRIPTVADHLDILAQLRNNIDNEEMQRSSSFLLFVKAAYVLDTKETLLQKKPVFIEYQDRPAILDIVRNLSIRDAGQASEFIEGKEEVHRISYAIQSFPCQHCHEEVGNVNVDVDELLFLESVQHFIK